MLSSDPRTRARFTSASAAPCASDLSPTCDVSSGEATKDLLATSDATILTAATSSMTSHTPSLARMTNWSLRASVRLDAVSSGPVLAGREAISEAAMPQGGKAASARKASVP